MKETVDYVIGLLSEDLVNCGALLAADLFKENSERHQEELLSDILSAILKTGNAVIGDARLTSPDYVSFIGWRGDLLELVSRAIDAFRASPLDDKDFAFWLCAPENVDAWEANGEQSRIV